MGNLRIEVNEDLGLNQFIIHVDGIQYSCGEFILDSNDELIDKLLRFFKQFELSSHTIPEIIEACTFLSDEDKEFCKLKYG